MAFTGVAVVKQVADNLVRITGVSLAAGANGTIGLFEKLVAAGVTLPDGFNAGPYSRPGGADVSLQDAIQVSVVFTEQGAVACPIDTDKAGNTPQDFAITLTNQSAGAASGDLEIYVRWH